MPETETAPPPEAKKKAPKQLKVYGIVWPDGTNMLAIEFACYRDKLKTGKPREFHLKEAFKMFWPKFQWNEWCDLMIWAWCNFKIITVIGHTRAGKTYFFAFLALLDFLANPHDTATTLTTTKFDALKTRMWGDMMRAVESIEHPFIKGWVAEHFKITNTTNELKFSQSAKGVHSDDKFLIQGVATDSGDKTAGKIRGQHADRRRIIVDEAQDVSDSIYVAFENAISAPDFTGVLLSNPVEKLSKFGEWCEPESGWDSISVDEIHWITKKPNAVCLHFDGLKSPNIKGGVEVNRALLTQQYIDDILKTSGPESLQWWMFVRGYFPPDGLVAKIWPSNAVEKAQQSVQFDFPPKPCATLDAAFESDDCFLHIGSMGRLRDGKSCIQGEKSHLLQTKVGPNEIPKDYQIARQVMQICKAAGVMPENFIMDETGNARGVLAILKMEWSPLVQGVNYAGEATERPMRLNDSMSACVQVKYFVTELWFRASFLAQAGMLCGIRNLDKKTAEDLNARRYEMKNGLMVAEKKTDLKGRLGRSPDAGDAFVQFGELMVRKGLLGEVMGKMPKRGWDASRQRAIKAASRHDNEFSSD